MLCGRPLARLAAIALVAGASACSPPVDPASHGSQAVRLTPATTPLTGPTVKRTVYVPVYSSIYLGLDIRRQMVDLTATVSVRNVSPQHRLVLQSVRYYDSAGVKVRDYLPGASELAPLASVEFVVQRNDSAGGPGANFLVEWMGPDGVDEPLVEAVMIGQSSAAGFSFTSQGRTLK